MRLFLARHYAHREQVEEALRYCEEALAQLENSGLSRPELAIRKANVYLRKGHALHRSADRHEEALQDLWEAVNNGTGDTPPAALGYIADIYLMQRRPAKAIAALDKAQAMMPQQRVRAHHVRLRGDAYLLLNNNVEEARRAYEEARELSDRGVHSDRRLVAWIKLGLARCANNKAAAEDAARKLEELGLHEESKRVREVIAEHTWEEREASTNAIEPGGSRLVPGASIESLQ